MHLKKLGNQDSISNFYLIPIIQELRLVPNCNAGTVAFRPFSAFLSLQVRLTLLGYKATIHKIPWGIQRCIPYSKK